MSEVQTLELLIKDNANEAATGLGNLARSLRSIRNALSGGERFEKLATSLGSFTTALDGVVNGGRVEKVSGMADALTRLADAVERLKGTGTTFREISRVVDRMRTAAPGGAASGAMDAGFGQATGQIEEIREINTSITEANRNMGQFTDSMRQAALEALKLRVNPNSFDQAVGKITQLNNALTETIRLLGSAQIGGLLGAGPGGSTHGGFLGAGESGMQDAFVISKEEAARLNENAIRVTEEVERSSEAVRGLGDGFTTALTVASRVADETERVERAAENAQSSFMDSAVISEGRMKAAVDTLWGTGDIDSNMRQQLYNEIGTLDFKELFGNGEPISIDEAKAWMRDLAQSLQAEMSGGSGSGGLGSQLNEFMKDIEYALEHSGSIEELTQRIENMKMALAEKMQSGKIRDGSEAYFKEIAAINRLIEKRDELERRNATDANARVDQLLNNSPAEMMRFRIDSMTERLTSGIKNGTMTGEQQASLAEKIQDLRDKLAQYNAEQEKAASLSARFESAVSGLKSGLSNIGGIFKNLKGSILSANGGLIGFLHGMMRVAKYRLFRSILREITEGFKTGLENYRKYSKAIGGGYSNDMDRLDDSLLKMKNSIGAALAPAIQALLPWIQRAISGFIELVNWVNQFFALLNGQKTWSKAVDVSAEDFENMKKGAKGAASAMKNLLASWDELNIIQSQSGGSGSGSGNENLDFYKTMFEEVDTFDGSVKETVEWLQDHLDLANKGLETLLLRLAGFKFSAIAVALALKDIYFEADEMGRAGASLEETLKESVDEVLLGALGAAAIGFSLAPSGTKLTGALIGFSVGASISLGLAVVKWAEGVESQGVVVEGFLEYLRNDVIGLIFPVLAAVALGAFVAGGTGALVALPLGAAISLGIAAVDWKSENELGKKPDFDEEDLRNSLGMTAKKYLNETAGGIAGGILGTQIAPGIGTLIGVTAGVLLGLAVTRMQYEKELSKIRNAQQQAQLFGPMHYDVQSMLDESTFGVSAKVMASFNVLKTSNEDLNEAREKVEEEAKKLEGTFKLTVGVKGFGDMTDQELSDLRTAADNYVKALKGEIEAEKATLKVSMQLIDPTDSSYLELKSSNEFLWKWLGIKEDMITKVGNAIGKYLGQGTVDEFKKEMPEIIKAIQTVTSFLSERKMGSEVAYNANELHEAFRSGKMDKESYDAYVKAYGEQKSGTRQTLLETYKKQYLGALEAYETAYGVLNDPEVKASLEKLGYDTSIYTEEFLKQAEEALKVYGENGSNIPKLVDEIIARIYKNADATFEADKLAALISYAKKSKRVKGASYNSSGVGTEYYLRAMAEYYGVENVDKRSNRDNFQSILDATAGNAEDLATNLNGLIYSMVLGEVTSTYGTEMGDVFAKNYKNNMPALYEFISGSDYFKSYIHDMFAQLGLTNDATIDKYIYQLLGGKGEGGIASFWRQYLPGAKGWGNSYNSLLSGLLGKGLANINGKWSIGYDFARDLREDMGLVNYDSIRNAIMGGDKTAFESFARDAAVQLVRNVLGDESAFELTNDLKNNPNLLYSMIEPELLYKMLFPAGYNGNVTYDVFQKMLEGFGVGKGGYIPTMNRSYNSGEAGGYGNEGAESEEDKDKAKGSEQIKQTGHLEEMDKTLKDMKQNGIPVRLTAGPRLAKLVNDSFRQIGKPLFENLNG